MSHVSASSSHRRASTLLLSLLVGSAWVASASAAPVNPSHRFEHIGRTTGEVAAILPYPGMGRVLVLQRNGDIHMNAGDRLVDDILYHLDVSQTCTGDGLLDATWLPSAPGQIAYVTYIAAAPRKFTVARLVVDNATVTQRDTIFSVLIPAGCTNTGGGIAVGADGKILVGIGDFGDSAGAAQFTAVRGKILRLNADLPGGAAADNPIPGSAVYGTGVRNPLRLTTDATTGTTYFLDAGPGSNDELNVVEAQANYNWPTATGYTGTFGRKDPIFVWATAIGPTGLASYRSANFGPTFAGDLLVTSATGIITKIHPDTSAPLPAQATEIVLQRPTGSEPGSLQDIEVPSDGYAYVSDPNGDTWRLRNDGALMQEPSDRESIVPMLVNKLSGGQLSISVERETALANYGLYLGDVNALAIDASFNPTYPHPLTTTDLHAVDGNRTQASSSFTVDPAGWPQVTYILASGYNDRQETTLGIDSDYRTRPGGNQTFGCPCPAGSVESPRIGDCRDPWTLAQGIQAGAAIGPVTFDQTWDCNVTLVDLSEGWCYYCHLMAPDLDRLYDDYKNNGFTLVTLISEGYGSRSAPATLATIQQWNDDPCYPDFAPCGPSTNPIILDPTKTVMNRYFNASGTCNGWPQSLVFDAEGVQTDVICGADPAGARAAVERNLRRAGYIP